MADVASSWIAKEEKEKKDEDEEYTNPITYEIIATSESGARAYNEDRFIVVEVSIIFLFLFFALAFIELYVY